MLGLGVWWVDPGVLHNVVFSGLEAWFLTFWLCMFVCLSLSLTFYFLLCMPDWRLWWFPIICGEQQHCACQEWTGFAQIVQGYHFFDARVWCIGFGNLAFSLQFLLNVACISLAWGQQICSWRSENFRIIWLILSGKFWVSPYLYWCAYVGHVHNSWGLLNYFAYIVNSRILCKSMQWECIHLVSLMFWLVDVSFWACVKNNGRELQNLFTMYLTYLVLKFTECLFLALSYSESMSSILF
jgi:hypothetical protein